MRRRSTLARDLASAPTRNDRLRTSRRRRARHRVGAALAVVVALATALPAAAHAIDPASGLVDPAAPGLAAGSPGGLDAPVDRGVAPQATIEDAEAWCSYLSSYYLSFPSPWSARVINCRHSGLFVAPVYSDGSLGMCVLVPARHSRHLGGNIARWVTDIRLC